MDWTRHRGLRESNSGPLAPDAGTRPLFRIPETVEGQKRPCGENMLGRSKLKCVFVCLCLLLQDVYNHHDTNYNIVLVLVYCCDLSVIPCSCLLLRPFRDGKGSRSSSGKKKDGSKGIPIMITQCGARTHDHKIKSLALPTELTGLVPGL